MVPSLLMSPSPEPPQLASSCARSRPSTVPSPLRSAGIDAPFNDRRPVHLGHHGGRGDRHFIYPVGPVDHQGALDAELGRTGADVPIHVGSLHSDHLDQPWRPGCGMHGIVERGVQRGPGLIARAGAVHAREHLAHPLQLRVGDIGRRLRHRQALQRDADRKELLQLLRREARHRHAR